MRNANALATPSDGSASSARRISTIAAPLRLSMTYQAMRAARLKVSGSGHPSTRTLSPAWAFSIEASERQGQS